MEEDNYKNNINKSMYVLKEIQHSLKEKSIGYLSIENIFNYIKFLENKIEGNR